MPTKKTKKISVRKAVRKTKPVLQQDAPVTTKSTSNFMIYVYWLVIVLFVGTTCYMLTRQKTVHVPSQQIVQMTEPTTTDEAVPYFESGKQKLIMGDTVGALNDFTIAIERNPSPLNYVYRGEVLMTGANYEAAVADFVSATNMNPNFIVAYYDMALANIKLEKLDAAKSNLDEAAKRYPRYSEETMVSEHDIYAKRAQVNLWLRNWEDAEKDYTTAISKTGGELDWNDYAGRAEARTNSGAYDTAIQDYASSVAIISDQIQNAPDTRTRENMSRQAMGYFEKSAALRVKIGQLDLANEDLQAAYKLAAALDDKDNMARLSSLISNLEK